MSTDELLEQMTQALEEAIITQNNYSEALEKLDAENKFLSETILNNQLGKITVERKELLKKVKESDILQKEAEASKLEYELKLDKMTKLIKDVQDKQSNVNSYIDEIASKKLTNERLSYQNQKKINNKEYQKYKSELTKQLQEYISAYEKKNFRYIIISIVSVLFGIIGLLIGFLERVYYGH